MNTKTIKTNYFFGLITVALILFVASTTVVSAKGRKFGLFVGINDYPETIGPLSGCVNDAVTMQETLVNKYGFKKSDTSLLLNAEATRDGIINKIKEYQNTASEGDVFVMHYSGHGGLFPDKYSEEQDETKLVFFNYLDEDGKEQVLYPRDKYDSTLIPVDADQDTSGKPWKNEILDDELYALFSEFTKKGVQVVLISDSCFSGGIAKAAKTKTKERFAPLFRVFGVKSYKEIIFKEPATKKTATKPAFNNLYLTLTGANVNETASDGEPKEKQMGLFTENLVSALNKKGAISLNYTKLMSSVATTVRKNALKVEHNQNPQLDARFGNAAAKIFSFPSVKTAGK